MTECTSDRAARLPIDEALELIAKDRLDIETLETRSSDDLDFHDVAVWRLKDALRAAYVAGQKSTRDMWAM